MFDKIRKLLELYRSGTLFTWEGARLVNQLIGEMLDNLSPDTFRAAVGAVAAAPIDDLHQTLMDLERCLPERQPAGTVALSMDWGKWLPILVQILSEILAGRSQ